MRRTQTTPEHAEAVQRRLATLSAEIAALRGAEPEIEVDADGAPEGALTDDTATRVRPGRETPPPIVLPVPGRHASRRIEVAGHQLGPAHLAVVAVVVALAVGLTAWWVVRDQAEVVPVADVSSPSGQSPAPLVPLESSAAPSAGTSAADGADGAAQESGDLVVDVAGKVRRPGIAVLPPGSRVVDALKAAGGARPGVNLTSLNLARPLVDGEQILVGIAPPEGVAGTLTSPAPAGEQLVNLNTADEASLETIPGVGPVTAAAIISWREENGGFTSVEELLEVDGIGDATLAEIAPHVTL